MHRTVEDYDSMAKREIIKAKQEKAMMYVCPEFNLSACYTVLVTSQKQ